MPPLISAEEIEKRVHTYLVFDARSGPAGSKAYRKSHLEGALHADLDRDLAAPAPDPARGGRHPLPEITQWARTLGRWGVTPETRVAVYDDQGGANAAARLWWLLRASGHRRVAVIDGGWAAAQGAGLPITDIVPRPEPAASYPVERWQWPTAELDEVERQLSSSLGSEQRSKVVDVRSAERFRGEVEPFDPVKGHIPGALNLPYTSLLDEQNRFLPKAELELRLDQALGPQPGPVIVHCGSGVTACHTLLAMEIAGRPRGHLYNGSWSEWCRARPDRIATGDDDL